jgi:hypothetical protein
MMENPVGHLDNKQENSDNCRNHVQNLVIFSADKPMERCRS